MLENATVSPGMRDGLPALYHARSRVYRLVRVSGILLRYQLPNNILWPHY